MYRVLVLMLLAVPLPVLAAPRVLVMSWDGADYRSTLQLISEGRLPNIARLNLAPLIASPLTITKPGYAEALTGQPHYVTGIYSNDNYNSKITPEMTIFGKIRRLAPGTFIGVKFSKARHTGDSRKYQKGKGAYQYKPWYHLKVWAKGQDNLTYLSPRVTTKYGDNLEETAADFKRILDDAEARPSYFLFCHWGDPDHTGHVYGMGSPEWDGTMEALDAELGKAVAQVRPDIIIVFSDHGFDDFAMFRHPRAPNAIIASNVPLQSHGLRWDLVPTIMDMLGFDHTKEVPVLMGRSLVMR